MIAPKQILLDTDPNLTADDDQGLSSQKAVKSFVENRILTEVGISLVSDTPLQLNYASLGFTNLSDIKYYEEDNGIRELAIININIDTSNNLLILTSNSDTAGFIVLSGI
jgi:hypothetical protein